MRRDKYSILYLQSSADLYGSDICLYNMLKELSMYYKCVVVLPYEGPLKQYLERLENVKVYIHDIGILRKKFLNLSGIFYYFTHFISGVLFLFSLIQKEKIDIIHSNTSAVLGGGALSLIASKKHIWHVREIIQNPPIFSKLLHTIITLFSTKVIAISNAVKENILANSLIKRDNKISVITDGIDCRNATPKPNSKKNLLQYSKISNDELIVGMVGRIHYRKGQDVFIKAAKIVIDKNIKAKFFIIGDTFKGYENLLVELKSMVRNYGLENKLFFTGFIEDKNIIYNAFDIFVQAATLPEAFGLVILEAMAHSLPVIAPDCWGPREIIIDGITGLLVAPGNPEALAAKIIYLSENPKIRKNLGIAAFHQVNRQFSIDNSLADIKQLYKVLLDD
jgi:glycosyltransferase involved in cell wall biosynthesis